MAQQKSKTYNPLPWIRTHKFLALLLAIVILIAGVFVYERVALEMNRLAFKSAQHAIDSIYADVVAHVGPPDNSKHENFCSRPSQVYGQGPLSCTVSTSFIYGRANLSDANTSFNQIQNTISKSGLLFPVELEANITSAPVANTIYTSATDRYRTREKMDCTVSYWFDTPRQIDLDIADKSKKSLEVIVGCNDWARLQYYPLH